MEGITNFRPGTVLERLSFDLTSKQRLLWERVIKSVWTFQNPVLSLAKLAFVPPPWRITLRDGSVQKVADRAAMFKIGRRFLFDHRRYVWRCGETGTSITMGGPDNLVIERGEYSWLPVRGRIVVDVGANVGDTALYFAARGAAKVYALEPFPYSVAIARENLALNPHLGQVTILNLGIGAKGECLRIDPEFDNSVGSDAVSTERGGVEVRLVSLSQLLQELHITDAVLKMDCEGAEYDAIISSSDQTLKTFSHIQIEYHYGPILLAARLKSAGFNVSFSKPRYSFNPYASRNPHMRAGYIYATRSGEGAGEPPRVGPSR